MQVLITSSNPAIANQLRFALTGLPHETVVNCIELAEHCKGSLRSAAAGAAVTFVVLPIDESEAIHWLRELRGATPSRLVAVGPADVPQRILDSIRAGADDYLDELQDIRPQIASVLQRVPAGAAEAPGRGKLIAVCSASGGGGATLAAANLAVLLARRESRCGAVDLSRGYGDLASLFSLTPQHTLADLCSTQESMDREMLVKSFTPHASGVQLIASAASSRESAPPNVGAVCRILQLARCVLPAVVVDLDPHSSSALQILEQTETILLLFPTTFTAACNARRLLDDWREAGLDVERVLLVGNRSNQRGDIPLDQAAKLIGRPIHVSLPDDPLAANLSINCGNPAVLENPQSSLSRGLVRLTDAVAPPPPAENAADDAAHRPRRRSDRPAVLAQEWFRRAASVLSCF